MRRPTVEELLERPDRPPEGPGARALFEGRTVLVTGAGGSIGSELCRQVQRLDPGRLFMLDRDETLLQDVQLSIQGHGLLTSTELLLCDIREPGSVYRAMQAAQPDFVLHAAAHKHLTLLENNPGEAVRTNVLGTRNVLRAAMEAGVSRLINISTDKAADPTSVLGASKRVAEMLVQMYGGNGTAMASVRFGNVLGSRGSFLPLLHRQLQLGLPVTITDRRVERFFMTIPEAASLVVAAATMARTGETFVLEMGDPVRILDLVDRYVLLSGAAPPRIVFTGLRPGEKISEVVFSEAECPAPTPIPGILLTEPADLPKSFMVDFQRLEDAAVTNNQHAAYKNLLRVLGHDGKCLIPIQEQNQAGGVTGFEGMTPGEMNMALVD